MAKQIISRGSSANDGTGDNLRDGANKINLNFNEIYTALGDGSTLVGTIKIADDSSTVMTLSANGETVRLLGGSGITSTISGNDLTLAVDGTVLSAAQTSTLTNKTIDLDANTITGTLAEFNTALQGDSFVSLTGSETLTNKTINASQLVNSSVANAKLTNSSITMIDDSSTTDAVALGENFRFTGGTGISSTLGSNAVTFAIDATVATLAGSQTLTNKTIDSDNNTITNIVNADIKASAAIANSKLANSSITLGDDTISLGGTDTSIANLSLTGSTGTIDLTSAANKIRFAYANTGSLPTAATYEGMFAYDYGGNNPYVADAGGWVKILSENSSIADLSNVGSIASISNGQVLAWNSGAGRFDPASAGGFSAGTDLDQAGADIQDAGYYGFRSPDDSVVKTITVTVATKTTEHYHHGSGSSSGYLLDGHESPALLLAPGKYKFDQADSSNSGHPLLFYRNADKSTAYTTGVTTSGTPGSSGAYTELEVDFSSSGPIHYQCSSHAYMGHVAHLTGAAYHNVSITTHDDLAETPASNDEVLIYDTTASKNKKVDFSYFKPTLTYSNGTATGDGSDTTFTITSGRSVNDVLVTVNGFLLVPTTDYSISGTTLTFATAPANSAEISIRYLPIAGGGTYSNGTATGDGSTTAFTINSGRSVEDVIATVNGVTLVPATDYSISGTTLTFATAPASSAEIAFRYLRLS